MENDIVILSGYSVILSLSKDPEQRTVRAHAEGRV
jgi:hypothetical protein